MKKKLKSRSLESKMIFDVVEILFNGKINNAGGKIEPHQKIH